MAQLEQLPREILQAISDLLDPRSVGRLGQTCRRINGVLQLPLVRAAKQYALPDEAEYKQRITFREDGKGILARERPHRLPPQPLVQAIWHHQLNKVKNYLEAGVDPNAYDLNGHRLLSLAVRARDEPIVDILLEHGADPALNDVCFPYTSPVMAATLWGNEMAKKLIRIGADYTHAKVIHSLANRCSLDVIKLAIDKGADFSQISLDDRTLLRHAENFGLIIPGGSTVIHHAATNFNHPDVLMFLIEKYPERLSPETGKTALWLAIHNGSADVVKTLITAGIDISGCAPLHAALAGRCSLDVVKVAVDRCPDFRRTSLDRRTVIHEAATNINHPDVLGFLIEKFPELLSSRTTRGKTALWSALYEGSAELAKILITAGIDMNVRDHAGKTALHAALNYCQQAPYQSMEYVGRDMVERGVSVATALIEGGIQVGIVDRSGRTELHYTLPLMRSYRHDTLEKSMPIIVRLLLSRSTVDVNALGPRGWTPLHFAARVGWLNIVRILVEEGNADVNETDNSGKTPADLAQAFPAVFEYLSRRAANRFSFI